MASLDGMKYLELARLKTEGEPVYVDPADELLVHATERYTFGFVDWRGIFGSWEQTLEEHAAKVFNQGTTWVPAMGAPHIWVPTAIAAGAAAAIIKNPVVTRRFWRGWFK